MNDQSEHKGQQEPHHFALADYRRGVARWCPGCGGHVILNVVQRLCRDRQLEPEKTVFVSGIGCSSRFPHYMGTYGFHGLHGRALPVACGIRARRPDLHLFVVTGDGDCCAIGASHWIHAVRYNMKMTVMMFNNTTYGLTKMQTSPTTPKGELSQTHPRGSMLTALNPLELMLGVSSVSFAARTADWNPPHLYRTLELAHDHPGFAFVEIMQRCTHFRPNIWNHLREDPEAVVSLVHTAAVEPGGEPDKLFPTLRDHDPSDLDAARRLASLSDGRVAVGLLYRNRAIEGYDAVSARGLGMGAQEKLAAVEASLDRCAV